MAAEVLNAAAVFPSLPKIRSVESPEVFVLRNHVNNLCNSNKVF